MAKRTNVDDLRELLAGGAQLEVLAPGAVLADVVELCQWFRIATTYKTEHSASASAWFYRRKLGERARVKAIGQSVYVFYCPPAEAVAA